jgi:hypothetical protein
VLGQLAEMWRTSQANISRVERTDDLFLSTLQGYIEAMGGTLLVTAAFSEAESQLRPDRLGRHPQLA